MCQILGMTRSSYYRRNKNGKSKREEEQERLVVRIKEIYQDTRGVYGSPRITAELKRRGERCNKKRVARLMKLAGIKAKTVKRKKWTTNSDHQYKKEQNVLGQNFIIKKPNRVWVSDRTYIKTREGWLYLAAILDLYSRRVVGWKTDRYLRSDIVIKALKRALDDRTVIDGMIFHSDQGIQYASNKLRNRLTENKMIQSMSRKGNCYDNAVAESFFHSLKTEHVNFQKYKTRLEAKLSLIDYIKFFYNRKRLHSSIGYKSPIEYEKLEM